LHRYFPFKSERQLAGHRYRAGTHPQALFCALAASVGTLLAMALLMARAFFRTLFANFGAVLTDQVDEFALAPHEIHRQATDGSAIPIQRYATRHGFRMRLLFTGSGAIIAEFGAFCTGFDTGLVWIVGHGYSLDKSTRNRLTIIFANPKRAHCSLRHITKIPSAMVRCRQRFADE
jgi:hypothetical protein